MSKDILIRKVIVEKKMDIPPFSRKEFEEYLVTIGGLIFGYRKDIKPIISYGFFEVGEGWYGLLVKLIEELIEAGWDKTILQVKEKFGGLRFNTYGATTEMHNIISKYCALSHLICENCGMPGKTVGESWLCTLCDEHAEIMKY